MALYGWRLFGVGGTVLIYLAGILFLSVTNIPGPHHPKKIRIGRFGELSNIRGNELMGLNRKQEIVWCKELKFLDGEPNFPTETQKTVIVRRTFFKGRFRNEFAYNLKKSIPDNVTQIPRQNPNLYHKFPNTISQNASIDGLTALASFPGSGNTWVRYMLQQATGILTGSIYKDYGLLKSGFPAENICNKSVLVVKTHEWGPKAWEPFSKAILIIRDPEKAILAEFNRQSGGHIGFASPDRYKRTKGRYWSQFVSSKLHGWETMNLAWAKNFTGPLKIIYYDDLVADVETHLRDILNFLEFKIDETLFACALLRKEGIFRRKKRLLTFDPYSPAMHITIEERKRMVYKILGRYS